MNSEQELRRQYDEVSESLHSRESIKHVAHAAVSFVVASISSGAATYARRTDVWIWGGIATALLYSLVRSFLGWRCYRQESVRILKLHDLRNQLKLNEPGPLWRR